MLFLNICKTYNHPSEEITKKVQCIIKTLSNEYETFYNHSGDDQSSQDLLIENEDVGKQKALSLKNESSKSTNETQDQSVTKKIVTQESDDVDTDDAESTNSTIHQYPNVKPSIHGDVEIPYEGDVGSAGDTVASAGDTIASAVDGVPHVGDTNPPAEDAVARAVAADPPNVASVPPAKDAVSPNVAAVPSAEDAVSPNVATVPPNVAAFPPNISADRPNLSAVLPAGDAVPPNVAAVPAAGDAVPPVGDAVPPAGDAVPPNVAAVPPSKMCRSAVFRRD